MRPQVPNILESIRWTLETYIRPELDDDFAESLAYTINNLLQHVRIRVEEEGPALQQDVAELRALLEDVRDLLISSGTVADTADLSTDIDKMLARRYREPGDYPTVSSLDRETTDLRWLLDRTIGLLDEREEVLGDPAVVGELRVRIREHLTACTDRHAAWMLDAFKGRRR